jgi:hypothetical protein
VPLLLKALPWTRAAARYLSNVLAFKTGQKKIAVKFRGSTKDGPANALKVISGTDKVGGFAGMQGVDVSNMAANGLNISNTGQIEFLAPAAAAMTIPVNALSESMLGSAGTEGGLKTLDTPTQNYYLGERRVLKDNIEELLGGTAKVRFVPISAEEQKTEVEQMFIAMQEGVISLKDYRNFLANFYQLGFKGKLPNFKETYQAQAMRYQFELKKEFNATSSETVPDEEINIDDPTNQGGANDDRDDDTGQPGPGKRTKVTKNGVL